MKLEISNIELQIYLIKLKFLKSILTRCFDGTETTPEFTVELSLKAVSYLNIENENKSFDRNLFLLILNLFL